jgi:hypothetical protein
MTTKGSTEEHQRILNETLILLGREAHVLCRVWDNPTGVAYRDINGRRVWITYGLKGSADIIGILCNGKFLAIEIKSGNAQQKPNQKKFQAMISKMGGHYFVARSSQEALDFVSWAATL